MNKIYTIVIGMLVTLSMYGQQEPQYTQYMYNTMSVNPGYAGTRGATSLMGLYRAQWVGLDGAPKTAQFSIHSPINYKGDGLGLSIINDEIGPARDTYVNASFAYKVPLSHYTWLNLGMMVGGSFLEVDYSKLNIQNPSDPRLTGKLSKFSANVGIGAYLYSEDWYVGLSAPALLETKFYDDVQQSVAKEQMHFYLIGGYVFDWSSSVKFKPATLIRAVSGAPLSVDLSANFMFDDIFTVGAAYRLDASISAMGAFQIKEGLNIGYAYDFDTTRFGNYNSGSHEIFIRWELFSSFGNKVRSPRFF